MKFSTAEYGTFWAWEAAGGLPRPVPLSSGAAFVEVLPGDLSALAGVLAARDLESARSRLAGGRRCYTLQTDGSVLCYGWVSQGRESAGELEREFNLAPDEAYIWDCATRPDARRKGCYSALLNRILVQLHGEGVPRVWIGAARRNTPSVRGIEKAGFRHVLDLNYRRVWIIVAMSLRAGPQAPAGLVSRAAEILLKANEKRLGRFAFGLKI